VVGYQARSSLHERQRASREPLRGMDHPWLGREGPEREESGLGCGCAWKCAFLDPDDNPSTEE